MTIENEREQAAFKAVDDALASYPPAPAPAALQRQIMASVRSSQTSTRFQIRWLDYAISLFISGMLGLMTFLWILFQAEVEISSNLSDLLLFFTQTIPSYFWLSLLGGGILVLAAIVVAATVFSAPRPPLVR